MCTAMMVTSFEISLVTAESNNVVLALAPAVISTLAF